MKSYTVIYRTGGTENFKWNRVLESYSTKESAYVKADELKRMGYPALVHRTELLDVIGLPETYDSSVSLDFTGRERWENVSADIEKTVKQIADDSGYMALPWAVFAVVAYVFWFMIQHGILQAVTALQHGR